jgi:hypothetical protein
LVDAAEDVGGELELQAQKQPGAESAPDRLALAVCGARPGNDPHELEEGLE